MILPAAGSAFEWRPFGDRQGLVCPALAQHADHVFTTRDWPLGSPAENDDSWPAVATALGVGPHQLRRARQVHGAAIVTCDSGNDGRLPEGDVVIVCEPGHAAAVQMADCVPLLFASPTGPTRAREMGRPRQPVVAAVHAGWRGLVAGAPRVAVEALAALHGVRAADLTVAIGPSIGACCYEVGSEVREAFLAAGFATGQVERWFHDAPASEPRNPSMPALRALREASGAGAQGKRLFLDTWAAAADQVMDAGVPAARVNVCGLCTASHPSVFCSYRRDGRGAGRLAAAITCRSPRPSLR